MKHEISLDALALFHLVASHAGFGKAQQATGVPKATLSRQVRALEEQLGLRLIHRDSRAFVLSDEGQLLLTRTQGLLADLKDVVDTLRHDQATIGGKLRISCPLMFGHLVMGKLASQFKQQYPHVQLEVTLEDREVDLVKEGYDLVIRVNPKPDSQLVGRCILRSTQHLVATRDVTWPPTPHTAVPAVTRSAAPEHQLVRVVKDGSTHAVRLHSALRLPSPMLIRDAVLAGGFAAVLPHKLIADDLDSGRLVEWGRVNAAPTEVWALHTSRRLSSQRVQALMDFLATHCQTVSSPMATGGAVVRTRLV
jgi:DNA-binding transcriptional LysR family regulator